MKKIVNNAYELIGETPILNAKKYALKNDIKNVELLVKLEFLNPAGSVKDRVAYAVILDAEKSGKLNHGGTIIEPTSGNTRIGIASIATQRGYKAGTIIAKRSENINKRIVALLPDSGDRYLSTPLFSSEI